MLFWSIKILIFIFSKDFGVLVFHSKGHISLNLDFKSEACLFLGYSQLHIGYKYLLSVVVYFSKDALFDEHIFPYSNLFPKTSNSIKDVSQYFNLNPNFIT